MFNYDALKAGGEDLKTVLDMLIPQEEGQPPLCAMRSEEEFFDGMHDDEFCNQVREDEIAPIRTALTEYDLRDTLKADKANEKLPALIEACRGLVS
jgi:hypothetical protein